MPSWTDRLDALRHRHPHAILGVTGPPGRAEAWVHAIDDVNAARIEKTRPKADFVVAL